MTAGRIQALQEIGFIWDSQDTSWQQRLRELREYRDMYGDCNVPSNYTQNLQLARWVKCQRRQYKLQKKGKKSNMTPDRIQGLESLGFEWLLRGSYRLKSQTEDHNKKDLA